MLSFIAREAYIFSVETGQKLTADSVVFSYSLQSGEETAVQLYNLTSMTAAEEKRCLGTGISCCSCRDREGCGASVNQQLQKQLWDRYIPLHLISNPVCISKPLRRSKKFTALSI